VYTTKGLLLAERKTSMMWWRLSPYTYRYWQGGLRTLPTFYSD